MTKAEARKHWATALRSGKYQQTVGVLRDSRGFCCLGVVCDVYDQLTSGDSWSKCHGPMGVYNFGGSERVDPEIQEFFGIKNTGQSYRFLADINDRERLSFAEIADIVESGTTEFFYD